MANKQLVPGTDNVTKKKDSKKNAKNNNGSTSDYFNHQLNVNESDLKAASKYIKDRADMNSDIMKLVPEIKQCKNILLSTLVSPNDFSKKELVPYFDNSLGFSETIVNKAKKIVDIAVARYGFTSHLYAWAEEGLFNSGADIELIMPRSMVEKTIQDSILEIDPKSLVGKKFDLEELDYKNIKLENTGGVIIDVNKEVNVVKNLPGLKNEFDENCKLADFDIEYYGNPLVLSIGSEYEKLQNTILDNTYYDIGIDKENIDEKTLSVYDKYKKSKTKITLSMTDVDFEPSKNELPFTMKLKSAATMPIFMEDPRNPLGYIILVDEMFKSIHSIPKETDLVNSLMNFKSANKSNVISSIVTKASESMTVNKDAPVILTNMLEIAENILLQTVNSSISSSIYKSKVELTEENSLIKIMLYRALNNMKTRMVFVPKQYISYIAFDYRQNGTGKTLLEDITLLASFKAMLTISEIYAAVNKNIPVTEIKATIDDDDPDPLKTKEMMEQDIYTSGSRRMIWGETSMEKHIHWVNNSRFRITWVHKTFPDNNIETETKNKDYNYVVDTETSDRVSSSIIKSLGLVPSAITDSENIEFASIEMLKNSLYNKGNNERQEVMDNGVSDRLRKYMLSDSVILKLIYDLIDSNESNIISAINSDLNMPDDEKLTKLDDGIKLQILKDIIGYMGVRLPRAENSQDTDNLKDKFDNYVASIDAILEALKTSSFGADAASELGMDISAVMANLKLHYVIKWCEEHNYARDIVTFVNSKDAKATKQLISYLNNKDDNIIKLIKQVSINKAKILENINKNEDDNKSTDPNNIDAGDNNPPTEDDTNITPNDDSSTDLDKTSDTPPDDDKSKEDEFGSEWDELKDDNEK